MRKRSRRSAKIGSIGLFYFQDIIFLTIGIVILVAALMSLSKRMAYLSSRDEFNDRFYDESLNRAVAELSYWKQAAWLLGQEPERGAMGLGEGGRTLASASFPGLSAEALFEACGGLWVLRQDRAQLEREQKVQQAAVSDKIRRLLDSEKEYRQIRENLIALEGNKRRVLLASGVDGALRQPFVLLLSGKRLIVYKLGAAESSIVLRTPFSDEELLRLFAGFPKDELHALLLLKPSGEPHFRGLRSWLLENGYVLGFEPVGEFYEFDSDQEQIMEFIR